jgi:uncharacterized membrane protein
MSTEPGTPGDRPTGAEGIPDEAYLRMALILRVGLVLALVLLAVAMGVYLAEHPHATWNPSETNPSAQFLSLSGMASGLAHGAPGAYLTVGVLCLVATPILRVLSGFYYFEKGRERAMMRVTILVFAMLMLGLFVVGPLVR